MGLGLRDTVGPHAIYYCTQLVLSRGNIAAILSTPSALLTRCQIPESAIANRERRTTGYLSMVQQTRLAFMIDCTTFNDGGSNSSPTRTTDIAQGQLITTNNGPNAITAASNRPRTYQRWRRLPWTESHRKRVLELQDTAKV
jgi:hypothetical protein